MEISRSLLKNGERAMLALRGLYSRYGYAPFKMSKFEEYDFYARAKNFLRSDSIITFTGAGGRLMALRPDVTLSIVKNVKDKDASAVKVYYDETVYRSDDSGELSEILQTGLECIGDIDLYQTGEVILLAVRSLATIGEKYILDISHMGFLAALLSESGADEETQAALLRCVGEKNPHGIAEICRSAAIPDAYAERIARAASLYGSIEEVLPLLRQLSDSAAAQAALDELDGLRGILRAAGCEQNVHLDLSIVHDMDYYNGIIMSGYLAGIPRAVLSGGRYDRLLRKMGKSGGAMGFALYLDLLERYGEESREYDADILLLYDSTTDPQTLTRTVEMLCEGGRSVRTQTCVPDGFRYGRLLSVKNGRLETLDEK